MTRPVKAGSAGWPILVATASLLLAACGAGNPSSTPRGRVTTATSEASNPSRVVECRDMSPARLRSLTRLPSSVGIEVARQMDAAPSDDYWVALARFRNGRTALWGIEVAKPEHVYALNPYARVVTDWPSQATDARAMAAFPARTVWTMLGCVEDPK